MKISKILSAALLSTVFSISAIAGSTPPIDDKINKINDPKTGYRYEARQFFNFLNKLVPIIGSSINFNSEENINSALKTDLIKEKIKTKFNDVLRAMNNLNVGPVTLPLGDVNGKKVDLVFDNSINYQEKSGDLDSNIFNIYKTENNKNGQGTHILIDDAKFVLLKDKLKLDRLKIVYSTNNGKTFTDVVKVDNDKQALKYEKDPAISENDFVGKFLTLDFVKNSLSEKIDAALDKLANDLAKSKEEGKLAYNNFLETIKNPEKSIANAYKEHLDNDDISNVVLEPANDSSTLAALQDVLTNEQTNFDIVSDKSDKEKSKAKVEKLFKAITKTAEKQFKSAKEKVRELGENPNFDKIKEVTDLANKSIEARIKSVKIINKIKDSSLDSKILDAFGKVAQTGIVTKKKNDDEIDEFKFLSDNVLSSDRDDLVVFVDNVKNTIKSQINSQNIGLDIINSNADLFSNIRIASIFNPKNNNFRLAQIINSKDKFADINSSLAKYFDFYEYKNNLYANIIGGYGFIKEGGIKSRLFGISVGYDKIFDNSLLGIAVTYAKANINSNFDIVKSGIDNYQASIYNKIINNKIEINSKLNLVLSKNNQILMNKNNNNIYTNEYNINNFLIDTGMNIGYVLNFDNELFVKPFVGFVYNYTKNPKYEGKNTKDSGGLALGSESQTFKVFLSKIGVELRQYMEDNYFYLNANYERELYKNKKSKTLYFISSKDARIVLPVENSRKSYVNIITGLKFKINNALSTDFNIAMKISKDAKIFNGNLGLSYKF